MDASRKIREDGRLAHLIVGYASLCRIRGDTSQGQWNNYYGSTECNGEQPLAPIGQVARSLRPASVPQGSQALSLVREDQPQFVLWHPVQKSEALPTAKLNYFVH